MKFRVRIAYLIVGELDYRILSFVFIFDLVYFVRNQKGKHNLVAKNK